MLSVQLWWLLCVIVRVRALRAVLGIPLVSHGLVALTVASDMAESNVLGVCVRIGSVPLPHTDPREMLTDFLTCLPARIVTHSKTGVGREACVTVRPCAVRPHRGTGRLT